MHYNQNTIRIAVAQPISCTADPGPEGFHIGPGTSRLDWNLSSQAACRHCLHLFPASRPIKVAEANVTALNLTGLREQAPVIPHMAGHSDDVTSLEPLSDILRAAGWLCAAIECA
eukprot:CAMPEP_0197697228 /NCGR_PEP_ID=MMETSP1338-20131121/117673_1 /TAXON_ID=43686 ORGANISM="Pelagodinium beii, Strain RCC1491" /NCGR_SAMPLE_ID=MMETSP1338 /ASSEMBLY_ACC=CAM_ASM_000754 /LENGTH=114 /DNA_ID=CAMNT_0043280461 /DNA_START=688 /DNA_END=1029 /DNA_ORIENTATION=-